MCGIVGFTGTQQEAPILLSGLSKLEYRGYDSAGIAVRDGERLAQVVKAKGRLGNLVEKTDEGKALLGTCVFCQALFHKKKHQNSLFLARDFPCFRQDVLCILTHEGMLHPVAFPLKD